MRAHRPRWRWHQPRAVRLPRPVLLRAQVRRRSRANLVKYAVANSIVLFAGLLPGVRLRASNDIGALLGLIAAAFAGHRRARTVGRSCVRARLSRGLRRRHRLGRLFRCSNRRFAGVDSSGDRPTGLPRRIVAGHGRARTVQNPRPRSPPAQWWVLATMGIGPTGIAFTLWDRGTKHGDIALIGSLRPTSRRCCRRCG